MLTKADKEFCKLEEDFFNLEEAASLEAQMQIFQEEIRQRTNLLIRRWKKRNFEKYLLPDKFCNDVFIAYSLTNKRLEIIVQIYDDEKIYSLREYISTTLTERIPTAGPFFHVINSGR